jgi:hypothetical protein
MRRVIYLAFFLREVLCKNPAKALIWLGRAL